MGSDTSTIVVICVGAGVVGACLALSLVAAVVDRIWRKYCMPQNYKSPADQVAEDERGAASAAVPPTDPAAPPADPAVPPALPANPAAEPAADPHVPYLICAVCGAPALYPDDIGGADPPPHDWDANAAWPPPPPLLQSPRARRPRSKTH